ncbi:MAG: hypothetical protein GX061_00525 [Eubacteriaceae bacterium]|nr:hypothetical protein [Eubacteriaceae bacterium]
MVFKGNTFYLHDIIFPTRMDLTPIAGERKTLMEEEFWKLLDKLLEQSEVIIDRPQGSFHPKYPHILYPLNYGYLSDTSSPDGAGIDVWKGCHRQGNDYPDGDNLSKSDMDYSMSDLPGLNENDKDSEPKMGRGDKGLSETGRITGIMVTADIMKRDSEIKLLIDCNDEEMGIIYEFHNESEYMKALLIKRKRP